MSIYIASLNSGSNGNCYYIGNNNGAILVDAGLSCRETETRMKRLGLSLRKVLAIFISHEHTDHILGIDVLSKRYHLPVYITEKTHQKSRTRVISELVRNFQGEELIEIGDFSVRTFPKNHDASDPHSFTISAEGITVGVFTDLGLASQLVTKHFSHCDVAFLETNYDDKMLAEGNYPLFLKQRISGEFGHLSNMQALELFTNHKSPLLSNLFLSHISAENNDPVVVRELFERHAGDTKIKIASRYEESELLCIS